MTGNYTRDRLILIRYASKDTKWGVRFALKQGGGLVSMDTPEGWKPRLFKTPHEAFEWADTYTDCSIEWEGSSF